jgi:hypothetical protein
MVLTSRVARSDRQDKREYCRDDLTLHRPLGFQVEPSGVELLTAAMLSAYDD